MFGFGYEPVQNLFGVQKIWVLEVRNLFLRIMGFFSNKTFTTRTAEDAKARISLASEEKPLLYPQITTSFYLWTFSSVLLDYFFRVIMGLFLDADGFFLLVVYYTYVSQWAKNQKKCNLGKLHSLPLHQSLKIKIFFNVFRIWSSLERLEEQRIKKTFLAHLQYMWFS